MKPVAITSIASLSMLSQDFPSVRGMFNRLHSPCPDMRSLAVAHISFVADLHTKCLSWDDNALEIADCSERAADAGW